LKVETALKRKQEDWSLDSGHIMKLFLHYEDNTAIRYQLLVCCLYCFTASFFMYFNVGLMRAGPEEGTEPLPRKFWYFVWKWYVL